jgi:hypothetical protein
MRLERGLAAMAFCVATTAQAQHWYDALNIRETFSDPAARPATFQYVNVAHDSAVLTIAAAVGYEFSNTALTWGPTVEYQRNTSASASQNTLRIGATGNGHLWSYTDIGAPRWAPEWLGNFDLKRDWVTNTTSLQASLSVTPLFRQCGHDPGCPLPNAFVTTSAIAVRYVPYIGAEYEHYGPDVVRGVLSVQSQYYPLPRVLDYNLQVTVDYAYRRSSSQEPLFPNRDHHLFTAAANVFILKRRREKDPDRTVGVSVSYCKGDNPEAGLRPQETTKAGITVQF